MLHNMGNQRLAAASTGFGVQPTPLLSPSMSVLHLPLLIPPFPSSSLFLPLLIVFLSSLPSFYLHPWCLKSALQAKWEPTQYLPLLHTQAFLRHYLSALLANPPAISHTSQPRWEESQLPAPAPVSALGVACLVSGWSLAPACLGPVPPPMKGPRAILLKNACPTQPSLSVLTG